MKHSPHLKKIKWITPSNLTVLGKCPYRIALSKSFDEPLLPYHPNIYLGNIIHKCIELIYAGKLTDNKEFETIWNELIQEQELQLVRLGFDSYLPLRDNLTSLPINKLQVKQLLNKQKAKGNKEHSKSYIEKWLKSKDGLIMGKVDLLYKVDDYIKIIDFKSGMVLDDEGNISARYIHQLHIYAYLCNEVHDQYPDHLSLVDLKNEEYFIDFTPDQCELLASEAKALLIDVNNKISMDLRSDLAKPDHEVCNSCLYKPACAFHWENDRDQNFTDLKGQLVSVRKFLNGNINVTLQHEGETYVVEGFDEKYEGYFKQNETQVLAIYNIVKLAKENRFGTMMNTQVYSTFA